MTKNRFSAGFIRLITGLFLVIPFTSFAQTPGEDDRYMRYKTLEMFEHLLAVFVILAILYAIVSVFRIKAENKIRQHLLEKGISEDTLKQLLTTGDRRMRQETLKWALVTGCTGIGLLISRYVAFSFTTFAILLISISAGLFLYYFLTKKTSR